MNETKHATVELVREGVRLVLPEGMSFNDAREWIDRFEAAENAITSVTREYRAFPLDGAAAFARAVKRLHGWTAQQGTTVSIPVPGGGTIDVPWGKVSIPGVDGYIMCDIGRTRDGLPCFTLNARTREKHKARVLSIFEATQQELDTGSIYRGRAVRFNFPDPADGFDPTIAPEFLDLSRVDARELVLRDDVRELVETTVLTPLRFTAALRAAGIPLKRGVLLEGRYGVGKTLLAYVTAQEATRHGWTYLYANVEQLAQAIEFALLYEPCVIFAEDVDQAVRGEYRNADMNTVLNTIDGVNVKGREIMVILTSNHADEINQAMMRYGRIDTVIEIPPPDTTAAAKLIELYARGMLEPGTDLRSVGVELDGQIPAMIREVVERAKLASIARHQGEPGLLSAHDLTIAARGMVRHQALLAPKAVDTRSDYEKAHVAAAEITAAAMRERTAMLMGPSSWEPRQTPDGVRWIETPLGTSREGDDTQNGPGRARS